MSDKATLFRDHEYGALAFQVTERSVTIWDHNLVQEDAQALRDTLSRYATRNESTDDTETWALRRDVYAPSLRNAIVETMRRRDYSADRTADRAIMDQVPISEAKAPDLPSVKTVMVHDAVERGVRQHLGLVVASIRESAPCSAPSLRFFARPNAQRVGIQRPPFVVSRMFTGPCQESVLREHITSALSPLADSVVKVSISENDMGHAVEIGLALIPLVMESYLDARLPVFEHNVTGAREVLFLLSSPLDEETLADLTELAKSTTAATSLVMENGALVARIPSGYIGPYLADRALIERMEWLGHTLEPWGGTPHEVGDLSEVTVPEQGQRKPLAELGECADHDHSAMKTMAMLMTEEDREEQLTRSGMTEREAALTARSWDYELKRGGTPSSFLRRVEESTGRSREDVTRILTESPVSRWLQQMMKGLIHFKDKRVTSPKHRAEAEAVYNLVRKHSDRQDSSKLFQVRRRLQDLARELLVDGDRKAAEFALQVDMYAMNYMVAIGMDESLAAVDEAEEEHLTESDVANTILQQIRRGMGGLDYAAMGIKRGSVFSSKGGNGVMGAMDVKGPGVQFDVRGHWKGRVIVRLDQGRDTYTVIFGRVRGASWKMDKRVDDVYAAALGGLVRDNVLGNGIRESVEEQALNESLLNEARTVSMPANAGEFLFKAIPQKLARLGFAGMEWIMTPRGRPELSSNALSYSGKMVSTNRKIPSYPYVFTVSKPNEITRTWQAELSVQTSMARTRVVMGAGDTVAKALNSMKVYNDPRDVIPIPKMKVGDRVSGRYMGTPFKGALVRDGKGHGLFIHFDSSSKPFPFKYNGQERDGLHLTTHSFAGKGVFSRESGTYIDSVNGRMVEGFKPKWSLAPVDEAIDGHPNAGPLLKKLMAPRRQPSAMEKAMSVEAQRYKGKILPGAPSKQMMSRKEKTSAIKMGNNTNLVRHDKSMGYYIQAPFFDVKRLVRNGFTVLGLGTLKGLPGWYVFEGRGLSSSAAQPQVRGVMATAQRLGESVDEADTALRDLERRAASSGDAEDRARYRRALRRSGGLKQLTVADLRKARSMAQKMGGPFRAPHYTANRSAMRGEVDLAQGGVLFLDELGSFSKEAVTAIAREARGSDVTVVVDHRKVMPGYREQGIAWDKNMAMLRRNLGESLDELSEGLTAQTWEFRKKGSAEKFYRLLLNLARRENASWHPELNNTGLKVRVSGESYGSGQVTPIDSTTFNKLDNLAAAHHGRRGQAVRESLDEASGKRFGRLPVGAIFAWSGASEEEMAAYGGRQGANVWGKSSNNSAVQLSGGSMRGRIPVSSDMDTEQVPLELFRRYRSTIDAWKARHASPVREGVVKRKKVEGAIYRKFPGGNKGKIGGKRQVMFTGALARTMGKDNYARVNLEDLTNAEIEKLAKAVKAIQPDDELAEYRPEGSRNEGVLDESNPTTAQLKSLYKRAHKVQPFWAEQHARAMVGNPDSNTGWHQLQGWERRDLAAELKRVISGEGSYGGVKYSDRSYRGGAVAR